MFSCALPPVEMAHGSGCVVQEAVEASLQMIQAACEGLTRFLEELRDTNGSHAGGSLKAKLAAAVKGFENVDWLVPPMLQTR